MFRYGKAWQTMGTGGTRSRRDNSDHRGYFFQPDDAGERAHFALLVFAQLEQQRHRRRFQLLHFFGLGIDRHAGRIGIGLPLRVNLAGDRAQRGLDRRPVGFLRRRKFQALLDPGDLDVAQQRVVLLRLRLARGLGLGRSCGAARLRARSPSACRYRPARSTHRPDAAARSAWRWPAAAQGGQRQGGDREPVLLAFLVRDRIFDGGARKPVRIRAAGTLSRPRIAVAAAPTTRKQVSATIVMARVKKVSISADRLLSQKLDGN